MQSELQLINRAKQIYEEYESNVGKLSVKLAQYKTKMMFEIGDLVLDMVIITGIEQHRVVEKLKRLAPEIALNIQDYRKAVHAAKVFKLESHRKILFNAGVPFKYLDPFGSIAFTQGERTLVMQRIKSGQIKSPWIELLSPVSKKRRAIEIKARRMYNKSENEYIFELFDDNGCLKPENVYNAFLNIVSQIGVEEAKGYFEQAIDRVLKTNQHVA